MAMNSVVIHITPGGKYEFLERDIRISEVMSAVGYLERVAFDGYDILCDEDGKPKGLPVSAVIGPLVLVGELFVGSITHTHLRAIPRSEAQCLLKKIKLQ